MRCTVLVAADGAGWEREALQRIESAPPGVALEKRCVDLPDLLATAATGQADVALVNAGLTGFDADSVAHLQRYGVRVLTVLDGTSAAADEDAVRRLGVHAVLSADELDRLVDELVTVLRTPSSDADDDPVADGAAPAAVADRSRVRTLAVWGATGAPGRTTVAVTVAAELARRGTDTLLVDADSYGGTVAQHLGVLDEVSGLLAAARLANAGRLDAAHLGSLARQVGPQLRLLTGLPRADRWPEVRDAAFGQVLDVAAALAERVVLDVGFCLEEDAGAVFGSAAPQRNAMTLAALEHADEVLVVGSADPVGLGRLARGLVELVEAVPACAPRVVVNRMRPSLGWSEQDVRQTLDEFSTTAPLHFLPEDRGACDAALASGRSLVELGDSPVVRAVSALVDAVDGRRASGGRGGRMRLRRRTTGTTR